MKNAEKIINVARNSYITIILIILGVFAFVTAVLIAWPGIAHIASKFF